MPDNKLVSRGQEDFWSRALVLSGASAWAALATLAGLGRVQISMVELLFGFAPLVIVPLGLELAKTLYGCGEHNHVLWRRFQVTATVAAWIALLLPPGRMAAWFGAAWLAYSALLFFEWGLRRRNQHWSLALFILDIAYADLVIGAGWFVISRAGLRPMGFQEPIIVLTAIHFHYSGFGTAVIAAMTLRWFEMRGSRPQLLRGLALLIALLPLAVAAGFVFSPVLRFVAVLTFAACLTILALTFLWISGDLRNAHARLHLRLAAAAIMAGMALAGVYTISEYFEKQWITIPRMANIHGVLNSLGFVLLGLMGWLIEQYSSDATGTKRKEVREVTLGHGRGEPYPNSSPAFIPEFVAREFYDR